MTKPKHECESTVIEKVWAPGDTYLEVTAQVFYSDGFEAGDKVRVTIEKLEGSEDHA